MRRLIQALTFGALSVSLAAQSTWYVDDTATPPGSGTPGAPYASIQYAISRPTTIAGDTVLVLPGVYSERIDFLGKAITVRAQNGASQTTIDASSAGSVAVFDSGEGPGSVLDGFRMTNGSGTADLGVLVGGGIYCAGSSPRILGCVIDNCSATYGAGVGVIGGSPFFNACTVRQNTALTDFVASVDGEGGGFYLQGASSVVIQNSLVEFNSCDGSGPGVLSRNSTLSLVSTSVLDNQSFGPIFSFGGLGGGLASEGSGSAQASNCIFSRNTILGSLPRGGGVGASNPVTLAQCTIEDNDAGDSFGPGIGGGVAGTVTATNCTIRGNYGELWGGGAYGASLYDCLVENNCSSQGAGAYGAYMQDSTLRSNLGCGTASQEFGGGAYQCTLVRCLVEGNVIYGRGGGAYSSTLTDCEVSGNIAYSPLFGYDGSGGGIFGGFATDCRIWGNQATGSPDPNDPEAAGGGAFGANLLRCVLHENEAVGGGVPSIGGGAANCALTLCEVFDNQADEGGGVYGGSADRCTLVGNAALTTGGGAEFATLASCIVRGNTTGQVLNCTVRYSNVQGGSAGIGNISSDPLFWNILGRDFFLRPGSPCIDTGDPAAPLDVDGTRADMGAHPFDPSHCTAPVVYCTAKTNSLGCQPSIGWSGSPTLTGPDDFVITATEVIGQRIGLLFWGYAPNSAPFQGGFLCVTPPTLRTPSQSSGGSSLACNGSYSHPFTQAYMTLNALVAGQEIYGQWWMRDPASPSTTGLSNALTVTVCP